MPLMIPKTHHFVVLCASIAILHGGAAFDYDDPITLQDNEKYGER